jgi:hypothetical protein
MDKSLMIVFLVPIAFFMLLQWPIKSYLGRSVKAEEKAGAPFAVWTLLYWVIEGAVPNRMGLAENQLFLAFVLGSLVFALLGVRTLRRG